MAAKKAAKKMAKKAAKKHAAKHHDKRHHEGRDARRAYEHLGRLEGMQKTLPEAALARIEPLSSLARNCVQSGDFKSAAELLRACEHLAFGAMASSSKEPRLGESLIDAVEAEYEHLIERAAERWDEHEQEPTGTLAAAYENAFADAETAFRKGAYRRALELARAAEALTHVDGLSSPELGGGAETRGRLRS